MALAVILAPVGAKDLDALPARARAQIIGDIESFGERQPGVAPGIKQIRGFKPPLFRLRNGDYRILYRVVGDELHVYRIIDRKDLERALKRLR